MPGIAWSARWTASSSSPARAVEIERARSRSPRARARAVARLLAAEADRQQLGVGQLEETGRRERIGGGAQPVEGGLRRRQRDLLLEDDVEQRRESPARDPTAAAGRSGRRSRRGRRRARRAHRRRQSASVATSAGAGVGRSARPASAGDRATLAEPAGGQRIEGAAFGAAQPGPGVLAERGPVIAALLEDDQAPARAPQSAGRSRGRRRSSARSRRSGRARTCRTRARPRPPSRARPRSPRAPGPRPRGSRRWSPRRAAGC